MRFVHRGLLAVLLATFLVPAATAHAQSFGPEHKLTNHGPEGDKNFSIAWPSVAVNTSNGEAIITYIADRVAGTNGPADLVARRIAPDGTSLAAGVNVNDVATDYTVDDYNPPSVAYAAEPNQYLVTWNTEDDKVFAQRLDAAGNQLGADIPVSDGNDDIEQVKAAYSPDSDSWLVVFKAERPNGGTQHIFARRYTASGDALSGLIQLSQLNGGEADDGFDVIYAPDVKRWLVVFQGQNPAPNAGLEIHGQFVDPNGNEIGTNDFRLSEMGPNNNTNFRAGPPRVAFDDRRDRFLVTWSGVDDRPGMTDSHQEAYGQLINADGTQLGEDDRQLSSFGLDGQTGSRGPDVVYNPNGDNYVVAYHADTVATNNVKHYEIFSQQLDAEGAPTGPRASLADHFPGLADAGAGRPQLDYNPVTCDIWSTYWKGDAEPSAKDFDTEIYARRILQPACPPKPVEPPKTQTQTTPPPVVLPVFTSRPPVLGLSRTAGRQRIGRNGYVSIVASCAAPCTVAGTGTVSFPGAAATFRLRTQTKTLTRAGRTSLRLRLSPSARRAVNRALRRKRRVTARVTITATDTVSRLRTRSTRRITARR